ncbi:hypothetical protein FQA39_LY10958 [Lamprigera yunnana]|nr:hypothetical protein FQA39_LY10958 [Lamprigera yunnana]
MMTSRRQKILQMTLTQAKCNEISEKPVITSLLTEENAFVADNTHDSIIEDAEIVMEIYPTTNSRQDIPHENLKILATGCGNDTADVISLNNDVYNTVFVSKNNVSFSNTEEILRDNTDESQVPESSPEHFVQGNGNEDKNNEFEKTLKINILQNIIQNNDNGPHYKPHEVDANNLQHKEDCSESEDPCYLPEERGWLLSALVSLQNHNWENNNPCSPIYNSNRFEKYHCSKS